MMEILLVNGPNRLALGSQKYMAMQLWQTLSDGSTSRGKQGFRLCCFQANGSGEIIDFLQEHRRAVA